MRLFLPAALLLAAQISPAFSAPPSNPPPARRVVLKRGADAPAELRGWFSALDRLLDMAESVTALLSRTAAAAGAVDMKRAADAAGRVKAIARLYRELTGDDKGVRPILETIRRINGAPAVAALKEAMFSPDGDSLFRWSQLMRQEALKAHGPLGRFPANSLLTYHNGADKIELAFLDVSKKPLVAGGEIISPSLAALVSVVRRLKGAPGSYVVSRRRMWVRRFGAEVFADFGAAENDGLLRLRYRDPDGTALDQARFYFLTKALFELGLAVSVQSGELVATLSGERSELDPELRRERFVAVWRALETADRLRGALKAYLKGSVSQADNARRLDVLARIFAAEGAIPFLKGTASARLPAGAAGYHARNARRESLRGDMDRTLGKLGLGSFPAGAAVGQRTIDLYFNAPIDAALARGELKLGKDGPIRDVRYDPLRRLAALPGLRTDLPAGLLGRARTIGIIGKRVAQRAQWRLGSDRWILAYVLREPGSGHVAGARFYTASKSSKPEALKTKRALALLEANGMVAPPVRVEQSAVRPGSRPEAEGAARVFASVLCRRGRGALTARITYNPAKALLGDRIFVTPYVAAADRKAARRSRALITTAGGARTAILAGWFNVSALNLPRAVWSESAGLQVELPVFGKTRRIAGKKVRPVDKRRLLTLREGDAVRIDAAGGTVEFLSAERQTVLVRLEEALRAYDRAGDINALAMWTAGQLTAAGLKAGQRRELAEALLSEMERRAKTGVSSGHIKRIRAVVKENL